MAKLPGELQSLADILASVGRDTAGALHGGTEYLASRLEGDPISASEALAIGRDRAGDDWFVPDAEGEAVNQELIEALGGVIGAVGSSVPGAEHLASTVGAAWSDIPDNVKAGLEMLAAPLDITPAAILSAMPLALVKGVSKLPADEVAKTVKAYKLFRKDEEGNLYPLFVDAKEKVPVGEWLEAKAGDINPNTGKVKSKIGELAYRPGWHAGDLPIATHIGAKSDPSLKKPDVRPDNQVWAEVEMADDVDWQSVADANAQMSKAGVPIARTAHITDQVPLGGHYRYKTNPNMTGEWLIGGNMRVNRLLDDAEVMEINKAAGVEDLPRLSQLTQAVADSPAVTRKVALPEIWNNVSPDDALAVAQSGAHLRRDKTGKYIGAPEDVINPQRLSRNRRAADAKVQAGAHGMGWYDDARRVATELAPDDPAMQSLFARAGAAYSPQASPNTEMGWQIKQHNQKVLTGEDVRPKTQEQADNVARAYDIDDQWNIEYKPEEVTLGEKTGPYADARDPTIPSEDLYKTANDIWHGRVMGYKGEDGAPFDRGFTPQEHAFLTGENLLLADRAAKADKAAGVDRGAPWDPRAAQAATWVAEREASYIEDGIAAVKKQNEKIRAKNKENAAKNIERAEHNARVDAGEIDERRKPMLKTDKPEVELDMDAIKKEARAKATLGIPDAVDRHSAYITSEARTGDAVDHLKMADDETDLIEDYTNQVMGITERDPVTDSLGMYGFGAKPTIGEYVNKAGELEKNPGFMHQALVSSELSDTAAPHMMPADRKALDMSALVGALARGQEAGAWSRFMPHGMGKQTVGDMNAVMHTGKPDDLFEAARQGDASVINYRPDKSLVTRFGDEGPVPGTTADLMAAVDDVDGVGVRGTMESGYQDTMLDNAPGSGKATENLLEQSAEAEKVIPEFEARTADKVGALYDAMNVLDRKIAKATGKKVREDLMKFRDIIAKGGIPALRKYVEKHGSKGLPAVVLGLVGAGAAGRQTSEDAGPSQI